CIPVATGEDIYLLENFQPLVRSGGVSVIHPDVLTAGGILETKHIGDFAYEHGVAVALHMAESPVGCLAAVHAAAAMPARRPKTLKSSSELPISRFLPCTPPITSPAA
ncbi:MAG: hypothetical protein EOM24_28750, partial [Chloroflexia bacterium]|nr:hypothetical protein [Chloroflexia bacterium]